MRKMSFPCRIALLYIFFGAIWILFSDYLVVYMTSDPHQIQQFSTYKGWLYVLVTGILLYYLIRNEIRRRTQIYNELLETKRKADESARLKTAFLSNLSHYIRTPMNSILGFIELIEDKDTSPENHQTFLSYINESSKHLLQTLNSIVEIAKIQEGQAKVSCQNVHLNELIERVAGIATVDVSTARKDIAVTTSCSLTNNEDIVWADADKILLILSNLASNSIRFTEKGEIGFGYSIDGDKLVLWVKDTGKGIPEDKRSDLFNDFLSNPSDKYSFGDGAGLGLALSARLAKLIGGNLWLENTGPRGTTFCLTIPNERSK